MYFYISSCYLVDYITKVGIKEFKRIFFSRDRVSRNFAIGNFSTLPVNPQIKLHFRKSNWNLDNFLIYYASFR